jgi:TrmH family RNA methyltransferase
MNAIRARDNPRVRRWRRLRDDPRARRARRRVILEGPRLVSAYFDSGGTPEALLVSESALGGEPARSLVERARASLVILAEHVFASISDTETPTGIAAEISLPAMAPDTRACAACVFLDGIQDAGNVGAILRSAAAFGFADAVLGRGCADAWSPKVLRAAAGAHFAMRIGEGADLAAELRRFGGRVACTVPRGGMPLDRAPLAGRMGWIFGAEGRGVSAELSRLADLRVTIPMPGAADSLNVAAAAAICFYEVVRRRSSSQ